MRNGMKKAAALLIAALLFLAALPASMEGQEQYSQNVIPGISLTSILPGDTPVATYVFHNGEAEYARQSVKDGETLYEPAAPAASAGSVFAGWFTDKDAGEQFTNFGAQTVTQTQTINLYARFATQYYVNFYTPDGSILKHVETVTTSGPYNFSHVTYEAGPTSSVTGWAYEANGTTDVSQSVTIPEGAVQVDLYAIVEDGYWVVFDTNGGSPVEPVFAKAGESVSLEGIVPTRMGYTFDGWYADSEYTGAALNSVSAGGTVYARWTPADAKLTVVFWYENANDAEYSLAGSTEVFASTGAIVSSVDYQNANFEGRDNRHFAYNPEKAETVTVAGDQSSILNVYFTRNTYTLTFEEGVIACGQVAHQHSHEECCTRTGYHWRCNHEKCPYGGTEHRHGSSCYKDLTITAKYQQDIRDHFPIKEGDKTVWWNAPRNSETFKEGTYLGSIDTMPGENLTFTRHNTQSGAKVVYYVETLSGQDGSHSYGGKHFDPYKSIDLDGGEYYLTYSEEFHDITGFTQWDSEPKFDKLQMGGETEIIGIGQTARLYYARNSYQLKFYNFNAELADQVKTVQYEALLDGYVGAVVPQCPAGLDPQLYQFDGWYTDQYYHNKVTEGMTMPASDVMLYAYWKPLTFEVTFDLGYEGAPEPPQAQTVNALEKASEPEQPTREGYNFLGWYDSETGSLFSFETQITKDTKLEAHWLAEGSFAVQYDANGGTGTPPVDATSYADGAAAVLLDKGSLTPPEGKVFLGWAQEKAATEAQYAPGGSMPIQAMQATNGVITLYAVWGDAPGTTTLTYNANYIADGAAEAVTTPHKIGSSTDLPNNSQITLYGEGTFTRPGYKLIGWSETPGVSAKDYDLGQSVIVDASETNILYAVWERSTVTVTIQKKVTGNMGDYTKEFEFKVKSTQPLGEGTGYTLSDGDLTATFTLQNGQSIALLNVPVGAELTIAETNATGYTTTLSVGDVTIPNPYTCGSDATTIVVTNHREGTPDTGISTDGLPYALLLGCTVAGAVLMLLHRRRRA